MAELSSGLSAPLVEVPEGSQEGDTATLDASSMHSFNSERPDSPGPSLRHSPFDQSPTGRAAASPTAAAPRREAFSPPIHLRIRKPAVGLHEDGEPADGEVLHCQTMRHMLKPMPSPFERECYFGAGFVSDEDRVSLQSLLFATPTSRGASAFPPAASAAAGPRLLSRTLSTPRSSVDTNQDMYLDLEAPRFALRAGPRQTIYYEPEKTRIAIVNCGGICPGLNDVVRALVLKALDYGVPEGNILGIRLGFPGFYSKTKKPIVLTRQAVEDIHLEGGTVLGSCETGECDVMGVVKRLDLWAVDMLFVIGGHHDMSSAGVVQRMCDQCSVQCAVVALPMSIDNDFLMVDHCFGYETCVEEAQKALLAAKVEASSAYRGIGLVKLMGRHSGFIAVKAALASGLVDVVLIPEVPFSVDAVASYVEKILDHRGHVVMCMAEGAGQDRFPQCTFKPGQDPGTCHETDSGNWMKQEMKKRLKDVDCKYIDPSYLIRSIPATSDDRVLCKMMAHGAVHAAFAGYTQVAVGQVNTHHVILPLTMLAQAPRQMDPHGELWGRLTAAIGQPPLNGARA